jgi:hypothetical protein
MKGLHVVEIPLTDNEREYPNEYTEVERPMLVQLGAMGWQYLRGDLDYPQKTFHAPFFGTLKARIEQERREALTADSLTFASLVQLTTDLVAHIQTQIRTIDFWRDDVSRRNLETWVYNAIRRHRVDGNRMFAPDGLRELATQVVDLAWHRRRWLVQ